MRRGDTIFPKLFTFEGVFPTKAHPITFPKSDNVMLILSTQKELHRILIESEQTNAQEDLHKLTNSLEKERIEAVNDDICVIIYLFAFCIVMHYFTKFEIVY